MSRADLAPGLPVEARPDAAAGQVAPSPAGRDRAFRKGRKHLARAREYARTADWLFRDFFGFVRWRSARVLVAGALHILTKFASMGVLYAFVDALAQGYPPQLAGWHLPPPDSPAFLLVGTVTAMALLILATGFRYDVRRSAIRLGRAYEEHCGRRVVTLASRLPDARCGEANRIVASQSMPLYVSYAKNCGMAARELTQLVPAFASFLVGCGVLLVLDARTTATIAVLAVLVFAAQYPANNRAAQASRTWERHRHESGRRLAQLFSQLRRAPLPIEPGSPLLDRLFATGPVRQNMDSFSNRTLGTEQASLISRIGSHLLLGSTLLLLGSEIIRGTSSWAEVAVYVAAVRFTLTDFVVVSKLATGFIRFHTQIHRYAAFVRAALPALAPRPATPGSDGPWPLLLPPLDDPGAGRLVLEPGGAVALLVPYLRGPPFAAAIMAVLPAAARASLPTPVRLGPTLIDPEGPLRAGLGLPPGMDEAAVEGWLRRFAPDGELPRAVAPGWLDRPSPAGWHRVLPPWALAALQLIAARGRGLKVVGVDGAFVDTMSEPWRAAWIACLDQAVRVVVRETGDAGRYFLAHLGRIGGHGETALLVADDRRLVAWLAVGPRDEMAAKAQPFFEKVFERRTVDRTEDEDEAAEI